MQRLCSQSSVRNETRFVSQLRTWLFICCECSKVQCSIPELILPKLPRNCLVRELRTIIAVLTRINLPTKCGDQENWCRPTDCYASNMQPQNHLYFQLPENKHNHAKDREWARWINVEVTNGKRASFRHGGRGIEPFHFVGDLHRPSTRRKKVRVVYAHWVQFVWRWKDETRIEEAKKLWQFNKEVIRVAAIWPIQTVNGSTRIKMNPDLLRTTTTNSTWIP